MKLFKSLIGLVFGSKEKAKESETNISKKLSQDDEKILDDLHVKCRKDGFDTSLYFMFQNLVEKKEREGYDVSTHRAKLALDKREYLRILKQESNIGPI